MADMISDSRLQELERLRDDITVRIHLAGLEAQQLWRRLEEQAVRALEDVAAPREKLEALITELRDLQSRLPEPHNQPSP